MSRLPDGASSPTSAICILLFRQRRKSLRFHQAGYPSSPASCQAPPLGQPCSEAFFARLNRDLRATVHEVKRLTPTIVEVIIKHRQQRGASSRQFYRLQNFETLAPVAAGTCMQMEGSHSPVPGWIANRSGLDYRARDGRSSNLCAMLAPGEPVVLMGPAGTPTHVQGGETVLLAGAGWVMRCCFRSGRRSAPAARKYSISPATRRSSTAIKSTRSRPRPMSSSVLRRGAGFEPARAGQRVCGQHSSAMEAYARAGSPAGDPPAGVDRIIAIGSDRMMAAVGRARHACSRPT